MKDWSKPQPVSDVSLAFGGTMADLMPTYAELRTLKVPRKWVEFQQDWFYSGLKGTAGLIPRSGVDKTLALRHLKTIQGSWEPKHEHKELGVAYLASLWFTDASTWEKAK